MDVGFTSAVLAGVVCLTVAIAILFKRPRRALYRRFAAFSLALFAWHLLSLASRLNHARFAPWQQGAALFIAPTAIVFFRELLRDRGLASRRLARAAWALSSVLFILGFAPWGRALWLRLAAGIYIFATLALIHRAMFRHMRRARSDSDRKRLSFLLYGGVVALLLTTGELVPRAAVLAALGHVASTFYVYFLYQSIIARRLIDLVELLGKAAVLAALTLLLAAIYSMLVLWVGSGRQGLWLFNTLVASFVILILYDQVRPWIEETTAQLLFRERHQLRQVVNHLTHVLRTTLGVEEMRNRVVEGLHGSGRATQVAMYLASETEMTFQLIAHRGEEPPRILSMTQQPTLLQELRRERRPILAEQLALRYQDLPTLLTRSDPTLQRELDRTGEALEALRSMRASVVIPMLVDDRIMGLLTLGDEHRGDAYSTDELALLLSLAEAGAVVIENSHEYEKQRERDRLVAVGEMAAGMAHEIRNPLGAIKGAAQCLDPQTLPADAREFIDVIIEEVDRLGGVVHQFLEYARPLRGSPMAIDINDVVLATLRLMGHEGIPTQVQLRQDLAHGLPCAHVDPEQLKQVLINLILNAIQAMPTGGQLNIITRLDHQPALTVAAPHLGRSTLPQHLLLEVMDDGSGISAEDMQRIFLPFFTTKAQGTGLGLAISRRIIEHAGGRIEVRSHQGEGTTFTLRLPIRAPQSLTAGNPP